MVVLYVSNLMMTPVFQHLHDAKRVMDVGRTLGMFTPTPFASKVAIDYNLCSPGP